MNTQEQDTVREQARAYREQADRKAGQVPADVRLGQMVLEAAAKNRNGIGDSDLDDEQPVTVTVSTTLGLLRQAGLRYVAGYDEPVGASR
jgi:hypothetical protein